jgi:hypothetical protein
MAPTTNRATAIACHHATNPGIREALERFADAMNTLRPAPHRLIATGKSAVDALLLR